MECECIEKDTIQTILADIVWLKKDVKKHGEQLAIHEQRINRKHEDILELKADEVKRNEKDLQFIETITKTTTLLDKISKQVDATQKEMNTLRDDIDYLDKVTEQISNTQKELDKLKSDVDSLMDDNLKNKGRADATKYIIALFFTVFGGTITFLLTKII